MTSVTNFDPDNAGSQDGQTSPSLALGGVKVKLEPVDPPVETQVESLTAASPLLPLGVHHRMRVYSRSTQSTSPETFVCEVCQGEFPYQEILQTHKLLHFNTRHVCYACDCYFLKAETLVLHVSTIHGSLSVVSQTHKGEIFVCSICLQRFSSKKILQKHENLHATRDEANYSCKICALDFIGYRALLAHLNSPRHREMKVKMQSIFVCVDCRSIFASRDSYAMHMMVRAQNESCDSKNLPTLPSLPQSEGAVKTEAPSPGVLQEDLNGVYANDEDSTIPLNLSKQAQDSSSRGSSSAMAPMVHHRHQHQCNRCSESFPTQDALAMHVMLHAKTEAEDEHKMSIQTKLGAALLARHAAIIQASSVVHHSSRPSSAPIPNAALSLLAMHANNVWSCSLCHSAFESCDMLAMHVMDKHAGANSQAEKRVEININHLAHLQDRQGSPSRAYDPPPQQHKPLGNAEANKALTMVIGELQRKKQQSSRQVTTERRTDFFDEEDEAMKSIVGKKRRVSLSHLDNGSKRESEVQEKRCKSADYVDPEMGIPWKQPRGMFNGRLGQGQTHHLQCDLCSLTLSSEKELHSHFKSMAHQKRMLEAINEKNEFQNGQVNMSNGRSVDEGRSQSEPLGAKDDFAVGKCSSSDSGIESWQEENRGIRKGEGVGHDASVNGERPQEGETQQLESRKSRRKMRNASRVVQSSCQSPESSEMSPWAMDTGEGQTHGQVSSTSNSTGAITHGAPLISPGLQSRGSDENGQGPSRVMPDRNAPTRINHLPRPGSAPSPGDRSGGQLANQNGTSGWSRGPASTPDGVQDADLLEFILGHVDNLVMCRFCGIIFTDRTMYYLHMGLHNVNNPWQCNLCGKVCSDVHQFSSHVIHY